MVTIPPGAVVVLLEVAVVGGSVDKVLGEVDAPVVDVLALVSEAVVEVSGLVEVGLVADVVDVVAVVVEVDELEVEVPVVLGDKGIGTSASFLYKRDVIKCKARGSRNSYCPERAGTASDEANEQNQRQVRGRTYGWTW